MVLDLEDYRQLALLLNENGLCNFKIHLSRHGFLKEMDEGDENKASVFQFSHDGGNDSSYYWTSSWNGQIENCKTGFLRQQENDEKRLDVYFLR